MGRLQKKVAECDYKELNRSLTKQFIGRLNDDDMTDEILGEVATIENMEGATTKHVLNRACRVEVQGAQRSMLNNIKSPKTLMPSMRTGVWCSTQCQMQILWGRVPTLVVPQIQKEV